MGELTAVTLVALALALLLTPAAIALARRTGFVDRPGALKPQARPVPLLGGASVFVAVATALSLARPVLLAPLGAALVLGLVDDRVGLSPWVRLAGQAVVAAAIAGLVDVHLAGAAGQVLVVVGAVLLMNGVNFLDGLDGLATSVVLVSSAGFAFLLHGGGRDFAAALCAALLGFLVFNFPSARVYLGDGGAYFLGAALAILASWARSTNPTGPRTTAIVILVGLPVAEVALAVLRRLRARSSMVHGDRRHPYDLLVARGWPRPGATVSYALLQLVLTVAALAVSSARLLLALLTAGLCAAALAVLARLCGSLTPRQDVT